MAIGLVNGKLTIIIFKKISNHDSLARGNQKNKADRHNSRARAYSDGRTGGRTDRRTKRLIESRARD